jgi:transcriptional regulator with XRE-family HTH domain
MTNRIVVCVRENDVEEFGLDDLADRAGVDKSAVAAVVGALAEREREARPWRDPETLYDLYYREDMTQAEVATELGCGQRTVSRWMEHYEIAPDGRHPQIRAPPERPEEWGVP